MRKKGTQSALEKRGMRLVRHAEKVLRFKRSRQTKALIDAIQHGERELALWLLKQGFYPHGKDGKGRSVLWWAAALKQSDVIRKLVKLGVGLPDDVLTGPVDARDEKTVRLLIQRGANVNSVASDYSPVGWHQIKQVLLTRAIGGAAGDPQRETVPILLIHAGATVNRRILPKEFPGAYDLSMLGLAANYGLRRTVQVMIDAGANVNIRDNRGRTPLFDAVEQGQLAVVKVLLRAGAKTNVRDNEGRTPAEVLRQQEDSPEMNHAQVRLGAGSHVSEEELNRLAAAWERYRAKMLALLARHSGPKKAAA